MPQPISLKKYCLLNIGGLLLSLLLCSAIYFIFVRTTVMTEPTDYGMSFSILPFIIAIAISHTLLTALSWWYLFRSSSSSVITPPPNKKHSLSQATIGAKKNLSETTRASTDEYQTITHHTKLNNTANTGSIRILIVDDNTSNILLLEHYLQAENREIVTATSGLEAIQHVEKKTLDLIFMDIEMAGMDGPSTVQHIRTLEKTKAKLHIARTPIIAVSAHDKAQKILDVLEQDFDDYLMKPVGIESLSDVMQRWQSLEKQYSHNLIQRDHRQDLSTDTSPNHATQKPLAPRRPHADSAKDIDKVINIEYSLSHSNNNKVLARDMLTLLIDMIKQEKANLLYFFEQQQWEKLYQLNHKIYGGSSYCGVPKLQTSNQQLERLLQAHLSHHSSNEKNISTTAAKDKLIHIDSHTITDIHTAVSKVCQAIDDILLWNEQHDINIIFNID